MSAPRSHDRGSIQARVRELGEWFHNIDLDGIATAPNHFLGNYPQCKYERFAGSLPDDLTGKSVLDIGCNAGFYSIEMKRRGAERVLGIDSDDHYLAQARLAAEVLGLEIEFRRQSVYDIQALGESFDVVLFMGVLYHLRYPMLALDLIHRHAAKDLLIFQSMLRGSHEAQPVADDYPFGETAIFERSDFPRLYFIEKSYAGDPTNWWIPNRAGCESMLRCAGFEIEAHPEEEVFICRKVEREDEIPLPSLS